MEDWLIYFSIYFHFTAIFQSLLHFAALQGTIGEWNPSSYKVSAFVKEVYNPKS